MKNNNSDDVLTMYLSDVRKVPLLKPEDEKTLLKKAKSGDKIAREKIITANLRFVISVALKYQNCGLDLSDLINEGNIGLLIALEKFDTNKNFKFISYAVWWIRQSILRAISEKSSLLRLPVNRQNELAKIKRKIAESNDETDKNDLCSISDKLGINILEAKSLLAFSNSVLSLDQKTEQDEGSTIADSVKDCLNKTPDEFADDENIKEILDDALDKLTMKEAFVIRNRFGLNGRERLGLKEIGECLNLSKERIRQLEKNALKKLKSFEETEKLYDFVA